MHRFERLDRLKKGGVMPERQTTVPAEELAERQALGAKYHAQRRINQINDPVRGIRASINILIKEETALLSERSALQGEGNGK